MKMGVLDADDELLAGAQRMAIRQLQDGLLELASPLIVALDGALSWAHGPQQILLDLCDTWHIHTGIAEVQQNLL